MLLNYIILGTFLVVQQLRLHTSTAGGTGLIPGPGTKISRATRHGQKKIFLIILSLDPQT